ncbi:arylsulfotransferase family protein, partial [Candidatus Pelagibacter sp.]|nr:arylsulfotransferase family protein [Candidatus Pelagibacter sp.]
MIKKFFTYPVFLILILSIIGLLLFGSLLRHHYLGGERLQSLQKIAVTIAEVPMNINNMIRSRSLNSDKPLILKKHKDKKRFEQFIENKRNALLILPRYEHSLSRSVVDIIDLNNFEIIHTYKNDIDQMNNQVTNTEEFPNLEINHSSIRFKYLHPLLLDDGSLIDIYGPAYKLDFCSKLKWINDEEIFHHSQMLDHEGNIWVGGRMNPKSQYVKKYSIKDFSDDSIIKINTDGKILFNKSITEILIENNIVSNNFALSTSLLTISLSGELDPIHLSDIEPAFSDTEYWKQGDVFISIKNQSAIFHYRPSTNKVINYITGPFALQHDIDIISDKEISIFNNNNLFVNNEHSKIVI